MTSDSSSIKGGLPSPVSSPGGNGSPSGNGNENAQKPKRNRVGKPKVKTGCNNCKQRRIKCDEKRPSCSNCIRSKKLCTGYPPPGRSARPFEEIKIAPKPPAANISIANSAPAPKTQPPSASIRRRDKIRQRSSPPLTPSATPSVSSFIAATVAAISCPSNVPILYRPASTLPFNEQEGLYFMLFREQTASELSGFFDNIFWSRGVLQECHSEAAIRHAVIALGALYKTLEKTCESPPSSPSASLDPIDSPYRHWEMAVKKYSHACKELFAIKTQDTRSHRTRLMASVLLACFDSFIGDHKQAIKQIQNGLGLLEQLRADEKLAFMPKPEEPVEEELIQMFTRLAIQAKSYDMAFHFPHPYVIRLTGAPQGAPPTAEGASPVSLYHDEIPQRFQSSREARLCWDALVERIFRFTEKMFTSVSKSNGPMGVLPSTLRQRGDDFNKQIQAWTNAYDHILASRTAPGVSSQEKAAIAVLKMAQIMSHILLLMTFSDSEMQFDKFTPQFKAIIDLALEVVGDEERKARAKRCPDPNFCSHHMDHWVDIFGGHEYAARHIKPSFSADLGIVPPLFVVATKCRDPVIRRQAIQLLKSSARREGMWDSELAARIGMWIAGIEEEEDAVPVEEYMVPGASRHSTNGSISSVRHYSVDFGDDVPLGPGGNARYDVRRGSQAPPMQRLRRKVVPEDKRVMIKAVEFDLRERLATIQLGTRGLPTGTPDMKTRMTRIVW